MGLKSYVLRFWEGEFEQLEPIRTDSGQRLYNGKHIALIRRIKTLLHDEGLTIEGARKRLDSPENEFVQGGQEAAGAVYDPLAQLPLFSREADANGLDKVFLQEIHAELLAIKDLLG